MKKFLGFLALLFSPILIHAATITSGANTLNININETGASTYTLSGADEGTFLGLVSTITCVGSPITCSLADQILTLTVTGTGGGGGGSALRLERNGVDTISVSTINLSRDLQFIQYTGSATFFVDLSTVAASTRTLQSQLFTIVSTNSAQFTQIFNSTNVLQSQIFVIVATNSAVFAQIFAATGSSNLVPGSTSYIQNRTTLQTGATFYVTSATIQMLNVSTSVYIGGVPSNGTSYSLYITTTSLTDGVYLEPPAGTYVNSPYIKFGGYTLGSRTTMRMGLAPLTGAGPDAASMLAIENTNGTRVFKIGQNGRVGIQSENNSEPGSSGDLQYLFQVYRASFIVDDSGRVGIGGDPFVYMAGQDDSRFVIRKPGDYNSRFDFMVTTTGLIGVGGNGTGRPTSKWDMYVGSLTLRQGGINQWAPDPTGAPTAQYPNIFQQTNISSLSVIGTYTSSSPVIASSGIVGDLIFIDRIERPSNIQWGGSGTVNEGSTGEIGGKVTNDIFDPDSLGAPPTPNATSGNSNIGGGLQNRAVNDYAAVGGGYNNANYGAAAVISGGESNSITQSAQDSGITSGSNNYIFHRGLSATIAGGSNNRADGLGSIVAGGQLNVSSADYTGAFASYNAEVSSIGAVAIGGTNVKAKGLSAQVSGDNMSLYGKNSWLIGHAPAETISVASGAFMLYNTSVGIGALSPTSFLDVRDGSITVRGTRAGIISSGTIRGDEFFGNGRGLTNTISIFDEGNFQSMGSSINCTGTGVSCSGSGQTMTINVTGAAGGGGGSSLRLERNGVDAISVATINIRNELQFIQYDSSAAFLVDLSTIAASTRTLQSQIFNIVSTNSVQFTQVSNSTNILQSQIFNMVTTNSIQFTNIYNSTNQLQSQHNVILGTNAAAILAQIYVLKSTNGAIFQSQIENIKSTNAAILQSQISNIVGTNVVITTVLNIGSMTSKGDITIATGAVIAASGTLWGITASTLTVTTSATINGIFVTKSSVTLQGPIVSSITAQSVNPQSLQSTNGPADTQVPKYDAATNKITWSADNNSGGGTAISSYTGLFLNDAYVVGFGTINVSGNDLQVVSRYISSATLRVDLSTVTGLANTGISQSNISLATNSAPILAQLYVLKSTNGAIFQSQIQNIISSNVVNTTDLTIGSMTSKGSITVATGAVIAASGTLWGVTSSTLTVTSSATINGIFIIKSSVTLQGPIVSSITAQSVNPQSLQSTNDPADTLVPKYDAATNKITWSADSITGDTALSEVHVLVSTNFPNTLVVTLASMTVTGSVTVPTGTVIATTGTFNLLYGSTIQVGQTTSGAGLFVAAVNPFTGIFTGNYGANSRFANKLGQQVNIGFTDDSASAHGVIKTIGIKPMKMMLTADPFFYNATTGALVLDTTGQTGINTSTPTSRLDVFDGSITVRGTNAGLWSAGTVHGELLDGTSSFTKGTVTSTTGFVGPGGSITALNVNNVASGILPIQFGGTALSSNPIVEARLPASAWAGTITSGGINPGTIQFATNSINFDYIQFSSKTQGTTTYYEAAWEAPQGIDPSTFSFSAVWMSTTATTGTARFCLQGAAFNDGDTVGNLTAYGSSATVSDAWVSSNTIHRTAESGALSVGGTLKGGSYITWRLFPDFRDTGYTLNSNALILSVRIRYKRSSWSD